MPSFAPFNRVSTIPISPFSFPWFRFLFSSTNPKPTLSFSSYCAISSFPILSGFSVWIRNRSRIFPSSIRRTSSLRLRSVERDTIRFGSLLPSAGRAMAVVGGVGEEALSTAKKFWFMSQKEATLAKYTPFVLCLASGKLEMETFRQYISQDIHFLRSFARAYEKAAEYADDDDAKDAIIKLRKAASHEINMHKDFIQELGIDPDKEVPCNPATLKYTNFLSATSDGKIGGEKGAGKIVTPFEKTKIAAYTVGAMVPCMRLYAFLGKEIEQLLRLDGSDNPYSKWLKNYSPSVFEEPAAKIEDLLDKLSVPLTGEELDVIQKLYHQAMKLEIEFFLAQPVTQPSVVPLSRLHDSKKQLYIFSDFDLTCSVVDSSAILAEIAIIKAPKAVDLLGGDGSIGRMPASELRDSWRSLSAQYTEEYEQCIDSLLPAEEAKSLDLEDLHKRLEHLSEFEKRANSRVIESGVLRGMNADDIKRAGEHLNLQDGCSVFFQKIVAEKERLNVNVHILSYCWCADLIRSAFSSVGCLGDVTIHSNEFEYEGSTSTGKMARKIESPHDKLQFFKSVLSQRNTKEHLSVYVGDSVGDLLCLLEADVGILVGTSQSLRRVGNQFGISFVPLFQGLVDKQMELAPDGTLSWNARSGVVYTVSGWPEIHAFVLGHDAS
ncbi:hypothetical protein HPP92_025513 [Vanilla planifolia]|uniref:Thiaminase-2/PQQC domain-containing protein n=1 Tax=Vanilla planifolia TaxID=51239 RepID=A0A835U930_VANPL|nr:hypothetical protein HPP92_025513 [Vanilla planifolia]